jgi:alkanesulfonate monooxygenase SsuD/methylene tetrahydromethanopterin reductase-like flavin-dependent oxidoreductase (luciferase family)
VEFGIFDQCERTGRPVGMTYKERFKLAQRAEAAGFYAYHVAEHHGTPLSHTPSPNLFLAALAQHTTTLRIGSLVYLLPLYEPYRLAQEIAMLDNLCDGRLEVGLGRGANPIELSFFGLTPVSARERFEDAYQMLIQGVRDGYISHEGEHLSIGHGPIDIRPVQRPYPPMWYPSAGGTSPSLAWAASQGFNTVLNGPVDSCAESARFFRNNFKPGAHGDNPKVGIARFTFVAETDDEAYRVGQPAMNYQMDNVLRLAKDAGMDVSGASKVLPPSNLEEAVATGWAVAGCPATVRKQLAAIFDKVGNNYFVFSPMLADLPLDWGLRTIDLFEREIMPAFKSERSQTPMTEELA